MGYDEQHGRISADVIHQYFYDDIAYYYQGSLQYIAEAKKDDPTYFQNIKPLLNDIAQVEMLKAGRLPPFSDANYLEYLRSEIELNKNK